MVFFDSSTVQEKIKSFFEHSIKNDRLAHAYIFYGGEGRGKEAFALELAKAINCQSGEEKPCQACPPCVKINALNHPDIKFILPVSKQLAAEKVLGLLREKAKNPYVPVNISGHKNIAIETIRELKNESKYAPYEAAKRVFIISGAEYFSREAANSFLKLLEEPPADLLIILITDDYNALLETIRSRCQPIYFPEFKMAEIKAILQQYAEEAEDIESLVRISQYNLKKVFRLFHSDYARQRESVHRLLKAVASDNMLTVAEIVDEITQRRDKNYILETLNLLTLWIRDALHYQIMEKNDDFVNQDLAETIENFARFYNGADMEILIEAIERACWEIERNMHPTLTLTNLTIKMQKYLKHATAVREAV